MTFLRSLIFNIVYFGTTASLSIYGALTCRHNPERALMLGRIWARISVWLARRICGIHLRVTGREHLSTGGPALIASQHQSAYDTMIWFLLLPRVAYVLKQELTQIPMFGPLAMRAGMIAVDRDGGASAIRALLRGARRAVLDSRQIVIFPEGTRAMPGEALPLQSGVAAIAAREKLDVIPVRTNSGRCWGRVAFAKHPGTVHVDILPPITCTRPRALLMRELAEIFQAVDNSVGTDPPEF